MARIEDAFGKVFGSDFDGGNNNGNGNGNDNGEGSRKGKRLDRREILKILYNKLLERFTFRAMLDSGEILYYDEEEHRYKFGAENRIKAELEILWPSAFSEAIKNLDLDIDEEAARFLFDAELQPLTEREREEIVKRVRYRFPVEREEFNADDDIINVKNGLLHISSRQLQPHTSDYLSIRQFPITYDPEAQPKELVKFLRAVQDTKGIIIIAKMFGYILMNSSKYEKAFMFIGKGDNGKSVAIKLIEAFAGKENCSGVRLHDIAGDKFMLAEFYGKTVNAYADISGQDIEDAGTFKALVSGDTIKAQKKHMHPFDFRNTSKIIYSANKLPRSQDDDMFAYAKRWVILHFKSTFIGANKDRNLIDKLRTDEELAGLLNVALGGLIRLEQDDGFEDIPIEDIRKEYERDDEGVIMFLNECWMDLTKKAPANMFMPEMEFYEAYCTFFYEKYTGRAQNDKALNTGSFEIELSKYGIFKRRKQIQKKKIQCYQGVITKEEATKQNMEILKAQKQGMIDQPS